MLRAPPSCSLKTVMHCIITTSSLPIIIGDDCCYLRFLYICHYYTLSNHGHSKVAVCAVVTPGPKTSSGMNNEDPSATPKRLSVPSLHSSAQVFDRVPLLGQRGSGGFMPYSYILWGGVGHEPAGHLQGYYHNVVAKTTVSTNDTLPRDTSYRHAHNLFPGP